MVSLPWTNTISVPAGNLLYGICPAIASTLYWSRGDVLGASRGHATERGCTHPGCDIPVYWSQVHHATKDWADGGHTDIDNLTLACGPDNRLVKYGGWKTRKRKDGTTEWIPPPRLDRGHSGLNAF